MDLFHIIDDGAAILRLRGRVWKQTKLYRRAEHVYVPSSGGFIRLTRGGGTTDPHTTCIEVEGPGVTITNGVPSWAQPPAKKRSKLAVVGAGK